LQGGDAFSKTKTSFALACGEAALSAMSQSAPLQRNAPSFHAAVVRELGAVRAARAARKGGGGDRTGGDGDGGAFYTLVPIRPRWRGERRSLRTFAVVSLRTHLGFNPRL